MSAFWQKSRVSLQVAETKDGDQKGQREELEGVTGGGSDLEKEEVEGDRMNESYYESAGASGENSELERLRARKRGQLSEVEAILRDQYRRQGKTGTGFGGIYGKRERERQEVKSEKSEEGNKRRSSESEESSDRGERGKKRKGREDPVAKLTKIIQSFKFETLERLKEVKEDSGATREEVKRVKDSIEKKEKIWEKMNEMEKQAMDSQMERRRAEEESAKTMVELEKKCEKIDQLKKIVEEIRREETEKAGGSGEGSTAEPQIEGRLRELEWKEEKLERERRKKNLIIRKIELAVGDGRKEVEALLTKVLEVEVRVMWVRKIGGTDRFGGSSVLIGLEDEG
ncbi:uncharacterized protein PF11_0207-like [Diachasma alloeum]|uniref:uncharacterized protein PF11_0207-like n=1 Tax=Diachasma alloeum TaxID=454923 RepID=UPI0010FAEBD6|nr:uncharacterized protein PF11_0207-like [Diachasma alloeum]